MNNLKYNYLRVNRGRYLCEKHGAFCDSSDNYLEKCPLCKCTGDDQSIWEPNNIDRALQVVNGLQKRSNRNATLVAGLIGGVWAMSLIGSSANIIDFEKVPELAITVFFIGMAFLVASIGLYAASMKQLDVIECGIFPNRTLEAWENRLGMSLKELEKRHWWAGFFFVLGVASMVAVLIAIAFCRG